LKIYISQGSVAMQLRCGGIFSNHFITNFSTKYASEKIEHWTTWRRYGQKFEAYFFGTTL